MLKSTNLPIPFFQQVIQLLQLCRQQPDLILIIPHLHLSTLVLRKCALYLAIPDTEIVQLTCLTLQQPVQPLDLLRQLGVVTLRLFHLALCLSAPIEIVFQAIHSILQLLNLSNLVPDTIFKTLFVLL